MFPTDKIKVDILAIGVHPDDVELGCGGTLIASVKEGKKVVVVDLTRGELGTRGTPETRAQEAALAAGRMNIHARENLGMRDGFFEITEENVLKVIVAVRKYQPEIILCNAPMDRHPDHGRSAEMVVRAAFLSGLRRIGTEYQGQPQVEWRPKYVFHYLQDKFIEPDFVFDVSEAYDQKVSAVIAYSTQFNSPDNSEPQTYISTPDFLHRMTSLAILLGKPIGVQYAEGFVSPKKLGIKSFDAFIQRTT